MRRRSDSWINATHILKVAGHDKPTRTRILEREVQKGVHEKVQGGYGKYQGTWISLEDGRVLAQRNHCLERLLPIFDFQPGDRSPPPAPKHMTAQTNKPKASRNMAPPRRVPVPPQTRMNEVSFDAYSGQANEDEVADQATISSASENGYAGSIRWPTQSRSRKRKRGADQPQPTPQMSHEDQQHMMWSDELLDYFLLQRGDHAPSPAPQIPNDININRPIDEQGNTALHWASAIGDIHLVHEFIQRGASINALTNTGATPLVRAVTFTNNYDRQSMSRLAESLFSTAGQRDCFQSTVFHHIAASTLSRSKYPMARYYFSEILSKLQQEFGVHGISELVNQQDKDGNTALFIAAKNGARKCVRLLTSFGARTDIPNLNGETAENFIMQLNERRRDRQRQLSSSPVPAMEASQPDGVAKAGGFGSAQSRASQYASEAATLLASQLPSLITSRSEALAAAYEAELAERETEIREAERLLELRRQELSTMRKQAMSLSAQDNDDNVAAIEDEELKVVLNDSRRWLEEEQVLELRKALARQRGSQEARGEEHFKQQSSVRTLREKLDLAKKIEEQQQRRAAILDDILEAQGLASRRDERHDIYKQLIMSALGIKADDVEAMLPDILQELEQARTERLERGNEVTQATTADTETAPVRMAMPAASASVQNGNLVYAPVQVAG
ncbi:MAG: hypothetical protein Q9162_000974 [Coniocarpon cinnabarinum]